MENRSKRITYLDHIRTFLVYSVVFHHATLMFAYPLTFWHAVIDKGHSSRLYETCAAVMYIYMMPCLMFIAAFFIFPSLEKVSPLAYLKKRFLRLLMPVAVFLFCAGDIFFQLLQGRLHPVGPAYRETFLNFWRSFAALPVVYQSGSEKSLHVISFNFEHTWFLTLLFFFTMVVVLSSLPFKKSIVREETDSRKTIILKTVMFAVVLALVYTTVHLFYVRHHINFNAWLIVGKVVQVQIAQVWMLIPLFLFGLFAYRKGWLTRGDIGNWKMWGCMAVIPLILYALLYHRSLLPAVDEVYKIVEQNWLSHTDMALPPLPRSAQYAALGGWLLLPPTCLFLLMFFLSFARAFFNKPGPVTAFCSKHSINVYVLHFAPVLILQYALRDVSAPSIIKVLLMTVIVISACLWLSHRLVYPYPKTAIGFFVALKLASLATGFAFYYYALLTLIAVSFAGAIIEFGIFTLMVNRRVRQYS